MSACFDVNCGDDRHARNVQQPELVRTSFRGLLQVVNRSLVSFDFCSPN